MPIKNKFKLAVIIINYKSEDITINFVKKELKKIKVPTLTIVVNNSANYQSNYKLKKNLDALIINDINQKKVSKNNCFLLPSEDNLGFAKANNYGVKFATNNFNLDFILFTNNDIKIKESLTVEKLIEKLEIIDQAGIIGPKVIGLDHKEQSPEPYISITDRYFWMFWITPFMSRKRKVKLFKLDYSKNAKEGFHYKIMGCFFLAKTKDFLSCEMMDENTFLYGEEVILSERLKKIDKKAYYYPEVSVIHEHGKTANEHMSTIDKTINKFKSEAYYYSKYMNVSKLTIFICKISIYFYIYVKMFIHKLRKLKL